MTIIGINNHSKGVEWDGFGTSLAWWAHYIGTYGGNPELVRHINHILFAPNNPDGLQLNIVRYNIGGGSDPENPEHLRLGADVPGWLLNGEYNWDADPGQLCVLNDILQQNPDVYLEVFSNSPPYFMLKSGLVSGHAQKGFKSNIKKENVSDFAKYLAEVVHHLVDIKKLPVKSISPVNEPSGYWKAGCGQEGCFWGPARRRRLINALHRELKERNLLEKVIISGLDENNAAQGFFGMFSVNWSMIKRVNIHSYHLSQFIPVNKLWGIEDADIFRSMTRFIAKHIMKKPVWMSEWGMGMAKNSGGDYMHMNNALELSCQIIRDIVLMKPNGWVYWQAVENISDSGWGLVQTEFKEGVTTPKVLLGRQFYGIAHFSRFVKPGYIVTEGKYNIKGVSYVVARSLDSAVVVVVIVSMLEQEHNIELRLHKDAQFSSVCVFETFGPNSNLVKSNALTSHILKPRSITTIQLLK